MQNTGIAYISGSSAEFDEREQDKLNTVELRFKSSMIRTTRELRGSGGGTEGIAKGIQMGHTLRSANRFTS